MIQRKNTTSGFWEGKESRGSIFEEIIRIGRQGKKKVHLQRLAVQSSATDCCKLRPPAMTAEGGERRKLLRYGKGATEKG